MFTPKYVDVHCTRFVNSCRELHLRAFCREIHQSAKIGGRGVKPILAMPGFSRLLLQPPLPYSTHRECLVLITSTQTDGDDGNDNVDDYDYGHEDNNNDKDNDGDGVDNNDDSNYCGHPPPNNISTQEVWQDCISCRPYPCKYTWCQLPIFYGDDDVIINTYKDDTKQCWWWWQPSGAWGAAGDFPREKGNKKIGISASLCPAGVTR